MFPLSHLLYPLGKKYSPILTRLHLFSCKTKFHKSSTELDRDHLRWRKNRDIDIRIKLNVTPFREQFQ